MEVKGNSQQTAEISQSVRTSLKAIREQVEALNALQKKEARKSKVYIFSFLNNSFDLNWFKFNLKFLCFLRKCPQKWKKQLLPEQRLSSYATNTLRSARSGRRGWSMRRGMKRGRISWQEELQVSFFSGRKICSFN